MIAKLCSSAWWLAGVALSAGCTSTLGLDEYEVTNLERCDDDLVDLKGDEQNCGTCGLVCPSGSDCVSGACACPDQGTFCDDAGTGAAECADLRTDEEHCGKCGESCAKGASCAAGKCACDQQGQTVCSDEANCGSCGTKCAKGASCNDGRCECDVTGEIACGGACTDLYSDVDHCGACGHACDIANAAQMCASAACFATGCSPKFLDCDGDLSFGESGTGCEVDSQTDDANCGSCGFACAVDRVCDGGACVCDVPDAGGTCDPRSNCGCSELGMNCSYQGGSWACAAPGYGTSSTTCTSDSECAVGHGCVGGVCHARCNAQEIESGACGANGACIQVVDSDGADVDGYQICAEPCNPTIYDSPFQTVSCPYNQQCVVADGSTVCAQAGTVYGTLGYSCSSYRDCAAGYGCVGGTCQPYCVVSANSCSSYFGYEYSCTSFSPRVDAAGAPIGYCANEEGAATAECSEPCNPETVCPEGAICLPTIESGSICMPIECIDCFGTDEACNYNSASCTFGFCG